MDESLFEFEPPLASVRYALGERWTFRALAPIGSENRGSRVLGRMVEPRLSGTLSLPVPATAWNIFAAPELDLAHSRGASELRIPLGVASTWGRLTLAGIAARTLRSGDDGWRYAFEGSYSSSTGCALSLGVGTTTTPGLLPDVLEYSAAVECAVRKGLSLHGKAMRDTREFRVGESQHFVLAGVALRL